MYMRHVEPQAALPGRRAFVVLHPDLATRDRKFLKSSTYSNLTPFQTGPSSSSRVTHCNILHSSFTASIYKLQKRSDEPCDLHIQFYNVATGEVERPFLSKINAARAVIYVE